MPLAESRDTCNQQVSCCARPDRQLLHCRHVRSHARRHCSIERSLHRRRHQYTFAVCSASQSPLQVSASTWLQSFVEWLHANGVAGLLEPEAKLALYEAEHEAGATERGVIFREVCQPIQDALQIIGTPDIIHMRDLRDLVVMLPAASQTGRPFHDGTAPCRAPKRGSCLHECLSGWQSGTEALSFTGNVPASQSLAAWR